MLTQVCGSRLRNDAERMCPRARLAGYEDEVGRTGLW